MINLKKILKNILYSGLEEDSQNYNYIHRLGMFNSMCILGFWLSIYLTYASFKESLVLLGVVNIVLSLVLFLSFLYIRFTKKFKWAFYSAVFVPGLIYVILFITGGVKGTGSLWFFTLPLIATFLLGAKKGLFSTMIFFIPLLFFLIFNEKFPHLMQYSGAFNICFISSFLLVLLFSYSFESLKQKFFEKAESRTKELEETVVKLDKTAKDLDVALKQVVESSKLASIGTLAAGVAHEINNPLTIIQGRVDIIEAQLSEKDIDINKIISSINSQKKSIQRIFKIVNGLRIYARFDSEEDEIFDIHNVINESISLLDNMFKCEDIKIMTKLEALDANIKGDTGKFQQVIMNLFTNSKDALESKIKGEINICTKNLGEDIEIIFSDNGCGIKQEDMDKIFNSFFTTKAAGKGTGLGLGISYDIIKKMDGSIKCNSTPSVGTSFILTFPCADTKISEN